MSTASRISRLTLDVDRTLTSGSSRIKLIYVSNGSASPVEVVFLDNDDIPLLNMIVSSYDSESFNGEWIADNGLHISGLSDSDIIVSILHNTDGA